MSYEWDSEHGQNDPQDFLDEIEKRKGMLPRRSPGMHFAEQDRKMQHAMGRFGMLPPKGLGVLGVTPFTEGEVIRAKEIVSRLRVNPDSMADIVRLDHATRGRQSASLEWALRVLTSTQP